MPFINNLLLGITNLRTKAGEKLNSLYADIGVKNNLTTANKSNLVGAVNEVNAKFIPYENAIKDADLNNKSLNNVNNIDTKNLKINTLNGILKTINGVVSIATPQVDYLTSVDLSAYATQVWVNSQGFLKSVPIASASTLGIIKVGTNLSISGDGTLSSNYINTTYSDGNGIKLVGTQFSMEVSVNGSGNTITDITQTADGISITKANVVNYTLPTATASVLGGIKVGTNLNIDGNGILSSTDTNTTYSVGAGLTQSGTIFSLPVTTNGSGGVVTNVTQNANGITITKGDVSGYTLPTATASVLGGIKVGSNLSIDGNGVLSATNTVTTYTAGNGLTLSGTTFSVNYGTAAGTAAQGDDARINNGQTAFDSLGNYTLRTNLNNRLGLLSSVTGGSDFYYSPSTDPDKPTGVDDGAFMSMSYDSGLWYSQLYADWRNNEWYVRTKNSGTWNSFQKLIHTGNISSELSGYVPTARTITINGVTQNLSANRTWTVPDTVTRLRGTESGTYTSGDITLLAGANTAITQSGANITIASTDTNTTYTAGNGLTLSGTTFSLPITTNGSGNGVSSITQTSTGITQNLTNFALLNHSHAFSEITSKPTTIGGYGITDAIVNNITNTVSDSFILKNNNTSLSVTNTGVNVKNNNNEQVVIKPNALTIINSSGDRRNLNYPYPVGGMIINDFIATSVNGIKANDQGDIPLSFSNLLNKPTTISGYGITDAMNKTSENIVSPTWYITNDSNYTAVSFPYDDKQGLEIGAGGLITRYAPNGIFPNLVVFEAQYQYQNLYFPKSTNKSRLEDRVLITSINGILADERGNVIIPNGGGGTIDTSNFVVKNASNNLTKDFQLVSSRSANNDFFTIRSSEGYASGRNGLMLEGLDNNVEGTRVIISRDGFIVSNSDGGSFDYKGNVFEGYNGTIFKASAFYETSLRKYKENITSYNESALQLVNDLEIVKFDRNDNLEKNVIGVIADDTNESFLSNSKDSVDLYKTIFIQAKAIQELSKRLKKLEKINNV